MSKTRPLVESGFGIIGHSVFKIRDLGLFLKGLCDQYEAAITVVSPC